MASAKTSAALVLVAVIAVVASSDSTAYAVFPQAEEEEAAQMNVKLLQVGTSTQRGNREDRQVLEEEENDEVELAQVRVNVKRGLHRQVGISADGGVRARRAGVAGTFARGRVAFMVAGDGSMVIDDEDNDALLGEVRLLQTKTQIERPARVAQEHAFVPEESGDASDEQMLALLESAGTDAMFADEGNFYEQGDGEEVNEAVDDWDANWKDDEQGADQRYDEFPEMDRDSAEQLEAFLEMAGTDAEFFDEDKNRVEQAMVSIASHSEDVARSVQEEKQQEELSTVDGTGTDHTAETSNHLPVNSRDLSFVDDEDERGSDDVLDEEDQNEDVSFIDEASLEADEELSDRADTTNAGETPSVKEAMSIPVEDDDSSLSAVQLMQTKARVEPVRLVQHRAVMSAESDGATAMDEEQEQAAENDGIYKAVVEDADGDDEWDSEWDFEADDDVDSDDDDDSYVEFSDEVQQEEQQQEEQQEESATVDGAGRDRDAEISDHLPVQEEGLDEEGRNQDLSFIDEASSQDEEELLDRTDTTDVEVVLDDINEDTARVALAGFGHAAAIASEAEDLDDEDVQVGGTGDQAVPVQGGPAPFGEVADITENEVPTTPVLAPERGDAQVEGVSLLQVDAAELDAEMFFSAEAAMLNTQLMQQEVVSLMQKPVAHSDEDGADDSVALLSGIPAAAGRNMVAIDRDGELREVETDDDRHSAGSGRVAMEVNSQGYAQWEE